MKKLIKISGMKCEGCENRIKAALENLDFVRLAEVDFEKHAAIVKMPVEVPDEILKDAVENLGYTVASIERLLCGCKNVSEAQIKELIESGADTAEEIIRATGLGSFGCCSQEIIPLLIEKYKNGKSIDIQDAVFKLNKKNDYVIAVNDAKKQLALAGEKKDTAGAEEQSSCH